MCEQSLESTDGYTRAFSSAAGRGVVQVAAHERCVLVQRIIHKSLHFKNSITRLFRQLVMAPGALLSEVIFESYDCLARMYV